jgi:GrpE
MRHHPTRLALFLLLGAVLSELGCTQSGTDTVAGNKNTATPHAEKQHSTNATTNKTDGTAMRAQLNTSSSDQDLSNQTNPSPAEEPNGIQQGVPAGSPPEPPPWWLGDPIILGLVGALIFLGLALHIVSIRSESRFKKELADLRREVQLLSQQVPMASEAESVGVASVSTEVTKDLERRLEVLDSVVSEINRIEQRITASERKTAEISHAVAIAARIAVQHRVNQALQRAQAHTGEDDRPTAIQIAEHYKEVLGINEARTRPLRQETRDLVRWLNVRSNLPPELPARIKALEAKILKFEQWHSNVDDRWTRLIQGSVSDRYSTFRSKHDRVAAEFEAGTVSIADYVKAYGELVERYFPSSEVDSGSLAPTEHETELEQIVAGVPDYLMDWFDSLSQLGAQGAQAAIDAETAGRLAQIQRTAKDVLCKFDIQPEEIQIGVTTFDRRLHDASLITQSPQYPTNTVVGVQQYGFRRVSTGDVLRRPKVIVAGVGAA